MEKIKNNEKKEEIAKQEENNMKKLEKGQTPESPIKKTSCETKSKKKANLSATEHETPKKGGGKVKALNLLHLRPQK